MSDPANVAALLGRLERHSADQSDGLWLEAVTVEAAPLVHGWNLEGCWAWEDWPGREAVMPPGSPTVDVGIDLVACRRDGGRVAIQCKARRLDADGNGAPVPSSEMDKFLAAAADKDVWAERWLVVNGAVGLGGWAEGKDRMGGGPPVRVVNLAAVLREQQATLAGGGSESAGSDGAGDRPQSRSEMQAEAVEAAVRILNKQKDADEPGIPRGEARGKIILPCGTGKTRIALRLVERLTYPGEVSMVLCPSIALVAQLRREFLSHADVPMRTMAVCSDQTVATAAAEEQAASSEDTTLDRGGEDAASIQGCLVSTDPDRIAGWMRERRDGDASTQVSVIFGTYQSASKAAEGVRLAGAADGFKVLVCDEAHRTAAVTARRRKTDEEARLREFLLCHDRAAFPATYRVYQTATPRIYGDEAKAARGKGQSEWLIRGMDDQQTFGVDLYRRSYLDAVLNGWLSDYRIIGMGVGGEKALAVANELVAEADLRAQAEADRAAKEGKPTSRKALNSLPTTGDYLKGMAFALAVGGGARSGDGGRVPISSCIGFLNTIARSQAMTRVLQSEAVRAWVSEQTGRDAAYVLAHLDASFSAAQRDEAKTRLAAGTPESSQSILNVGIFSEGTDAPSLSAVAFLEPRKSPIDVVQAVGRAMRLAHGKEMGYIVVPVVFPSGVDAEEHLSEAEMHEGWNELGEILRALRAHDQRIEDALPERLRIQPPPEEDTQERVLVPMMVSAGRPGRKHAEHAVARVASAEEAQTLLHTAIAEQKPLTDYPNVEPLQEAYGDPDEGPSQIVAVAVHDTGEEVNRSDKPSRYAAKPGEDKGAVNVAQSKKRARDCLNRKRGRPLLSLEERQAEQRRLAAARRERDEQKRQKFEAGVQDRLNLLTERLGEQIAVNLLERSGLTANRTERDLNLLRSAVEEAARLLESEPHLKAVLDAHFDLVTLEANSPGKPRASGATIAALLWMNAAMLHQRIAAGGWLKSKDLCPLAEVRTSTRPHDLLRDAWQAITRQDFRPVIDPAIEALTAAIRSGRLAGLTRALRHLAGEAERIAAVYADMGVDHAGALFNKVMGDQASDGAFFTRPIAATLTARLAFDAIDPDRRLDWSDPEVWREHKIVDLACGSGTLLAAALTEMKDRARDCGADRGRLARLQKLAVEKTIKGLDINPISIQLAATQLMSGNQDIKYRGMGLHLMPYGPQPDGAVPVAAGSVELLERSEIVNADAAFTKGVAAQQHIDYGPVQSEQVRTGAEEEPKPQDRSDSPEADPEMEDAVEAVSDAQLVIMNPPFTARTKMGEKYPPEVRKKLRARMDTLETYLSGADPRLSEFLDKNSLRPRFAALASLCLNNKEGVFATIIPTTALSNTSGLAERLELARRFHIHTILTGYGPRDVPLSQHSESSESVVIMRRHQGARPPTRIVALDRLPADEAAAGSFFEALRGLPGSGGALGEGWGEVSYWPAERIEAGDWSTVVWRSAQLAEVSYRYSLAEGLRSIASAGLSSHSTGRQLSNGYACSTAGTPGAFPILDSSSVDVQTRIGAEPDAHWVWSGAQPPPILSKAAYLFVTTGNYVPATRLTALATTEKYVGRGWRPVTGTTPEQAQAVAVFINSTVGRLLLTRLGAKFLHYPNYNVEATNNLPIPDITNPRIVSGLAQCCHDTRAVVVPQFRDGYVEVRRAWDRAVCDALGWDYEEISRLGELLHREPRVAGVGYGQWK